MYLLFTLAPKTSTEETLLTSNVKEIIYTDPIATTTVETKNSAARLKAGIYMKQASLSIGVP